ncbi:hypothetical protein TNCT_151861 [Trichonephila clavata]|uniref:Uncharacterized protein n=1 Tax=Trichonephila clavata TaxID=2740835 RepID=A0A8X6EZS8_TRICU|nr:hypothetical protein TNCT_151861 [Trichonephila clavata]
MDLSAIHYEKACQGSAVMSSMLEFSSKFRCNWLLHALLLIYAVFKVLQERKFSSHLDEMQQSWIAVINWLWEEELYVFQFDGRVALGYHGSSQLSKSSARCQMILM